MKRTLALTTLSTLFFACASANQQWSGKGGAIAQAIPVIQEELQDRLQEFGLLQTVTPVSPVYALTSPDLTGHQVWKTPYGLKVFNTSDGAGYAITFGPQAKCPESGAIDCNLGLLTVRVSDQPLKRQPATEVPLVIGTKGYLDNGGIWWRIKKTNYDLVLTDMTPTQQVVFVNAALTGDRAVRAKQYKFVGKIGSSSVSSMDLRQVGNELWGTYSYQKTSNSKSRLYLYGSIKNGAVTLKEFDLNSGNRTATGSFTGKILNQTVFSGSWVSSVGKRSSFRFTNAAP